MTDRPYNAGNRKDVRSAEKAQLMLSVIDREVISGIMSVKNGRQWMYEHLAECQAFQNPFSPDPYVHAYNSGLKSIGIKLFNDVMLYAPSLFDTMLREAHERAIILDRVRNRDDGDPADGDDGDNDSADAA